MANNRYLARAPIFLLVAVCLAISAGSAFAAERVVLLEYFTNYY